MRTVLIAFLFLLCAGFAMPGKPKVLIIGDSISIGYFPFVKEALKDKADLLHNPGNAQATQKGLKDLDKWLGTEKWDVIQFNWGLWDLAYRSPESKIQGNRDKVNGKITSTPDVYRQNLEALVTRLEKTGAKLIFVTTTFVPGEDEGRFAGDEVKYNAVALDVMKKHGIKVNDLYTTSVGVHAKHGLGANNVHYSAEGYQELSKQIIKGLEEEIPNGK
ncbi:MAG TPA: SGNH/GDSL hydrolase family protein [Flavisolibacter sp.]|nr:SGNH/GDSL hydrolase family protein [Flavisolibacter sp.]